MADALGGVGTALDLCPQVTKRNGRLALGPDSALVANTMPGAWKPTLHPLGQELTLVQMHRPPREGTNMDKNMDKVPTGYPALDV